MWHGGAVASAVPSQWEEQLKYSICGKCIFFYLNKNCSPFNYTKYSKSRK